MSIYGMGRLSGREYEQFARRVADQDRSVVPKLDPRRPKGRPTNPVDWVQVLDALITALNKWERDQW
jgi:hypothetical protein